MFQERARTLEGLALGLDALCICAAFGVAVVLRILHDSIPLLNLIPAELWTSELLARTDYAIQLTVTLFVWLAYIRRSGLYIKTNPHQWRSIIAVYLKGLVLTILATGVVVFALKTEVSRLFIAELFTLTAVLLITKQVLTASLSRVHNTAKHRRNALVIGSIRPATWFAGVVEEASQHGYRLVGVMLPDNHFLTSKVDVPVVGTIQDMDYVLANHPVDEVFIVGTAPEMASFGPVAQELIERGHVVSLVSALSGGKHGMRGRVTNFNDIPLISYGPMPKDMATATATRMIDICVSGAALLVAGPLILCLACLIKRFDPGPVFFSQERLGWNGKRFRVYKLRSMRRNAEETLRADLELYRRYVENDFKLPEAEDPRVSKLGRFLRKSSLDELPQLWNVLRGDMTLVGPRPIVPTELQQYEPYGELLLSVKPGLTGRWQASGRSDVRYPERAYMDLDYVSDHSLVGNLGIMAKTVPSVFRHRGAH